MGFGGKYHPVHIVCDMDGVRSNIISCEKKINMGNFKMTRAGLEPGMIHMPPSNN